MITNSSRCFLQCRNKNPHNGCVCLCLPSQAIWILTSCYTKICCNIIFQYFFYTCFLRVGRGHSHTHCKRFGFRTSCPALKDFAACLNAKNLWRMRCTWFLSARRTPVMYISRVFGFLGFCYDLSQFLRKFLDRIPF